MRKPEHPFGTGDVRLAYARSVARVERVDRRGVDDGVAAGERRLHLGLMGHIALDNVIDGGAQRL